MIIKDFDSTKHLISRAALNFKTELTLAVHITSDKEALKYDNFSI